ncbi:hypothetical protein JD844_021307 [Phrynosoma platyrhinos]|uniref:Phospholipase A2 n=1 Tax=Phrynosoma platyrhinos TaxID=52577 RepID=A0ABQ7STK0_PHRPL|nr:hypothetical protein JD844_021307 [Phrynosoma platyrhinos]
MNGKDKKNMTPCIVDPDICNDDDYEMERFPCNLLTVRVIRMRNARQADAISQSDCYVTLWLPTAACEKLRTKTINNCKNPVWNETFYYRIQRQVKNVLELAVYDEDAISTDDHLFTIRFDVARLPVGKRVLMYFKSDPKCREVCKLEAAVDQKKRHKSKKDLSLSIKGSCEGHHLFKLGSDAIVTPPCPTAFHYIKYKEPTLDVMLPKTKPRYNPRTCSYSTKGDVPPVMLNSLPVGEKVPIIEIKCNVSVCPSHCSCPEDLDVRLGYDLCPQEAEFLWKRKRRVAQALKQVLQLNYDLQDHEVPVVAVMTTGGGMRSYTTTYGCMSGLQKLNLLDCITYISGLSGTSWAMAHMYRDAYWSQKDLCEKIEEAKKQVTKSKMEMFTMNRMKYYHQQLNQRKQEGHKTTFIDLWGLVIEYLLNDGVECLSSLFLDEEPNLPTRPYEIKSHMYVPAGTFATRLRGVLTDRLSVAQYHNFLKGFQLHNCYLENESFQRWQATVLDHCPNQLTEHENHLGMVDAGFFINTSCPPLLRPERKVDVIVHFSYSAGSQTLPLEYACKYYKTQGIPFPDVVLTDEDKKHLKECYYFNQTDVPGCPILVFFPLVNDTFRFYRAPGVQRCCDAEMDAGKVDVSTWKTPYSTYCLQYSDENFDKLVNLSEYNVLNNRDLILRALHAAVERKRGQQHC